MTTFYLIRHGAVDDPNNLFHGPSFHLSDQGRQQITNLAQEMKSANIQSTRSWYSPYVRTTESCEIINDILGITNSIPDERLVEWNVGTWFDKPLTDFYAATHYDQTPPRLDNPQLESLDHMADRVIAMINDVFDRVINDSALIIAHREPLVSAMLKLQGLSFDTIHNVDLPVGSAWELIFDNERKLTSLRKAFDHHLDT